VRLMLSKQHNMMPMEVTPFIPLTLRGIEKEAILILRFPSLGPVPSEVEGVNSA